LPSGPDYRRAARVRNTSCRCRPAMSGRVPGRRGEWPDQIGRSRRDEAAPGGGRHGPAEPGPAADDRICRICAARRSVISPA